MREFVKILNQKGWAHDEKYKLLKFLETMAKIRTLELKRKYVEFLRENVKEEEKTMLMIEELAIKQGISKGISIGEQRGISIGEQRGRFASAQGMFKKGFDAQTISEITGISIDEVRKLTK